MDHEKIVSQINNGSTASVCLQWMQPIFDEVESNIITNLKTKVRQGEVRESVLLSGVSSLIAIEDLKFKLQGIARVGDSARKKLEGEDE